jgi:UDP-4-amino-4,6-dideoxy-N-acetyl-beta-L-altrosamine N-acetyltransferase
MFNHDEICLEDHLAWFAQVQKDPTRYWYLFRDVDGTPQGVLYFTDLDTRQRSAFWGFYAQPAAPPGTGTKLLFEGLDLAFDMLCLHKVSGEVLADNSASIHLHKKVGFSEEGRFRQQHFDGSQRIDIVRLGILASEWGERRSAIAKRLQD